LLTADELEEEACSDVSSIALPPKKVVALSSAILSSGIGGFGPAKKFPHFNIF
jgi:hypothetical protein